MAKRELLDSLRDWYSAHVDEMAERGIILTFGRSDDERPKQAAWLGVERGERLAEIIIWDSGEAELVIGEEGNPEASEHHEINDADEIGGLATRLIAGIE
jgi:hypothetical protein